MPGPSVPLKKTYSMRISDSRSCGAPEASTSKFDDSGVLACEYEHRDQHPPLPVSPKANESIRAICVGIGSGECVRILERKDRVGEVDLMLPNVCCRLRKVALYPSTDVSVCTDELIRRLEVRVLKSPPRCPMANAICERVIGTFRRERLDRLLPLSESQLRSILKSRAPRYNAARPHTALGPGVRNPPATMQHKLDPRSRPRVREVVAVSAHSVLGGLHHEYLLAPTVV
jgi:hypothetical protein